MPSETQEQVQERRARIREIVTVWKTASLRQIAQRLCDDGFDCHYVTVHRDLLEMGATRAWDLPTKGARSEDS